MKKIKTFITALLLFSSLFFMLSFQCTATPDYAEKNPKLAQQNSPIKLAQKEGNEQVAKVDVRKTEANTTQNKKITAKQVETSEIKQIQKNEKKQQKPELKQIQKTTTKQANIANVKEIKPNKNKTNSSKTKKVSYKIVSGKKGQADKAVVFINDKQVVQYNLSTSKVSSEDRAKFLVSKLEQFIAKKGNPNTILPCKDGNFTVIKAGNLDLLFVDSKSASVIGLTVPQLALKLTNNIRQALGGQKISRNRTLIASRGLSPTTFSLRAAERDAKKAASIESKVNNIEKKVKKENFGKKFVKQFRSIGVGVASWYGGRFQGRKTASGTIFNTHLFTAAHKTLPMGSIVKVTNLKNGKSCVVKITDRGPYIKGRVIDLSKAAAKKMGMVSSGISHVKLEIVDNKTYN